MQGAIAASAPVRAFASRLNPTFVPSAFWEVSMPSQENVPMPALIFYQSCNVLRLADSGIPHFVGVQHHAAARKASSCA